MAAAATRPSPSWADLNSELLVSIAGGAENGLSLRDYQCVRAVCSAWRSALAPPYPCLLSLADGGDSTASAFCLPMRRSFNLYTASEPLYESCREGRNRSGSRVRVVGSGDGRLAVAIDQGNVSYDMDGVVTVSFWRTVRILLLDPRSRGEYGELPPPPTSWGDYECVLKAVFTPDAGRGTVVATCSSSGKVSYIDTGSARGRDMAWTAVDVVEGRTGHLTDLAFDTGGGKLYCLDSCGVVHVLGIPHNCQDPAAPVASDPTLTRLPAVFPAPYDAVFALTRTKHLFFCHGSLYQIWQNTSAAVKLPSGFRISLDEIHVVRYDPGRWPAWEVVKDLGGSSVFVGRNSSPAVVRAADAGAIPGVRPNRVYWINWKRVPMVCDVATGTSVPFVTPLGNGDCWYFDDDSMRNNRGEREKLVGAPAVAATYNWLTIGVCAKDNWLTLGVREKSSDE